MSISLNKRPIGRPRTVTPPHDELQLLGEEMIEWVQINNPIHLSMWWGGQKFFTADVWKNMCDCVQFSPYYEEALRLVGYNYLFQDSGIEPSVKQRWLRVYFKDLKRNEDETARFNAELKNAEKQQENDNLVSLLMAANQDKIKQN